jgi:hypothetical protein
MGAGWVMIEREDSMNTLQKNHTALVSALVTTLACVAGSASAESANYTTVNESIAAVDSTPTIGSESKPCTLSGDTATGREWGKLVVVSIALEGGNKVVTCERKRTGGEAPVDAPHCKSADVYRNAGCTKVVD